MTLEQYSKAKPLIEDIESTKKNIVNIEKAIKNIESIDSVIMIPVTDCMMKVSENIFINSTDLSIFYTDQLDFNKNILKNLETKFNNL